MLALKCRNCGKEYEVAAISICDECFGPLEVVYDMEEVKDRLTKESIEKGPKSIWRYKELLPVEKNIVDLNAGFTPLHKATNLAKLLGLKELYIKNDSVNPTFSFKDRVVSVAVSKAIEFGFKVVGCASTGNLASSVAAHAAKANLDCYIFIPHNLNLGKIIQTLAYEPNLIAVEGNYDDVNRLCAEIAEIYNWAFVNINIRPFYAEGSKTLGFEVAEQLNWETPDVAIVPVGSGSLLTKIYKGFNEFHEIGLIEKPETRFIAAQALGCSPVVNAFHGDGIIRPVKPNTIEKSLAIGNPADGYFALKVLKETRGYAQAVSDDEIISGIKLLAKTEGIFTETAGGVVVATLKKLVENNIIEKNERVVIYITGNGLKTQDVLANSLKQPAKIKADLKSFEEYYKNKKKVVAWH